MTRDQKLAFHLEAVIWADVPEGQRLTAAEVEALVATATDKQWEAAYRRALTHNPVLLPEERQGLRCD